MSLVRYLVATFLPVLMVRVGNYVSVGPNLTEDVTSWQCGFFREGKFEFLTQLKKPRLTTSFCIFYVVMS